MRSLSAIPAFGWLNQAKLCETAAMQCGWPSLGALGGALGVALLVGSSAAAQASALGATLSCETRPEPGRIACEARLVAPQDKVAHLSWGDLIVTQAPAFAQPLRARVTRKAEPGSRELRIPLALMASEAGAGEVAILARAVVCRSTEAAGPPRCEAAQARAIETVRVGTAPVREAR